MATVNYNNVFDSIIEAWNNIAGYYEACDHYYKKHGFHPYLDLKYGMDDEKRHIMWTLKWHDSAHATINVLLAALFDSDYDQTERLFVATRALRRWYDRTEWQYIPKEELINRLAKFVEG